jgi:hypothetical protein
MKSDSPVEDDFSIPASFWLNRELSKVKDEKRRAFLERVFRGVEGYQRFIWIMTNRRGAWEFENGTWPKKLPKYTKTQLDQEAFQTCSGGCGNLVRKIRSPWGEVIDNPQPICATCKKEIDEYFTRRQTRIAR